MTHKLPLVAVEWLDHVTQDGWQDDEEAGALEPAKILSIGWVVKETESCLTLASAVDLSAHTDETKYNNLFLIIKGCIVTRKEIDDGGRFVLSCHHG